MIKAPINEMPFNERIKLREKVLAWISLDMGLFDFLVPDSMTSSWSNNQKQIWTAGILSNYLKAPNTEAGKAARERVLRRDAAGNLRRACGKLRQDIATYRDTAKISALLESVWHDVSPNLDDRTWARISHLFDTALISLRVAYLWLYGKSENEGASLKTKKKVFETLVDTFFEENSPAVDEKDNSHSPNFKDLLAALKHEYGKYTIGGNFEAKLDRLEKSYTLRKVADNIDHFLNAVAVDNNWVLSMQKLEDAVRSGIYIHKDEVAKRRSKKPKPLPKPMSERKYIVVDPPDNFPEEDSSFEPAVIDSDFDYQHAEDVVPSDDDDDAEMSDEISDDIGRGMMSQTRGNGSVVRRSIRVAQAGRITKRRHRRSRSTESGRPTERSRRHRRGNNALSRQLLEVDEEGSPPPQRSRPRTAPSNAVEISDSDAEPEPVDTHGGDDVRADDERLVARRSKIARGRVLRERRSAPARRTGRAVRRTTYREYGEHGANNGRAEIPRRVDPRTPREDPTYIDGDQGAGPDQTAIQVSESRIERLRVVLDST